jgi:hypothetical protein
MPRYKRRVYQRAFNKEAKKYKGKILHKSQFRERLVLKNFVETLKRAQTDAIDIATCLSIVLCAPDSVNTRCTILATAQGLYNKSKTLQRALGRALEIHQRQLVACNIAHKFAAPTTPQAAPTHPVVRKGGKEISQAK